MTAISDRKLHYIFKIMKKLLPALLVLLLSFASCKKEQPSAPTSATTPSTKKDTTTTTTGTTITTQAPPAISSISSSVVTAGKSVALSGTNLPTSATGVSVLFNGVAANIQFILKSGIGVIVPVTTSGNIKVVIDKDTLAGPAYTYVDAPVVTGMTPTTVSTGSVVTITGTNLMASGYTTTVSFTNVPAVIQSITATEIKAVVPKTTNGTALITTAPGITAWTPQFNYISPELLKPYVSGNVTLTSQADVDAFAGMNKGKQLQITGDLNIQGPDITSVAGLSNITSVSGRIYLFGDRALTDAPFLNTINNAGTLYIVDCGFTSLSFNSLNSFSGIFYLNDLNKLSHISFTGLTTPASVSISNTPLLTDLSFLQNITSIGGIFLKYGGATELNMNKLTSAGIIDIYGCDFKTINMRSLTSITSTEGLSLRNSPSISNLEFTALTSITGKLTLSSSNVTDMKGFSSLKSAGSLALFSNPSLSDLKGLANLTTLTSPALGTSVSFGVVLNGIDIELNPKLTSLAGLQNVSTVPIITITRNTMLNDFCPLKGPVNILKNTPAYSYRAQKQQLDMIVYYTSTMPALALNQNGSYATTQDALAAVALCQ